MAGGFGFPFGCAAAVAALIAADLAGATAYPWYALVTLGLVVLATAWCTTARATAGVAVVAWALDDGFILGRAGELTFTPASATAALVLALPLAAGLLARATHWAQPPDPVSTPQSRESTPQSREPTLQAHVSSAQVRESSIQVREFAAPVRRIP
jgi:hypothetical protein